MRERYLRVHAATIGDGSKCVQTLEPFSRRRLRRPTPRNRYQKKPRNSSIRGLKTTPAVAADAETRRAYSGLSRQAHESDPLAAYALLPFVQGVQNEVNVSLFILLAPRMVDVADVRYGIQSGNDNRMGLSVW